MHLKDVIINMSTGCYCIKNNLSMGQGLGAGTLLRKRFRLLRYVVPSGKSHPICQLAFGSFYLQHFSIPKSV
ncbi:hypothetical protein MPTK1_Vg00100 [Marchantia polymorpha subsp. ruderalis]|uniref:Uncharacterized protein n=1 Tax=Marchantia polymorpha TaxID=3197 RepID=A0A2R6VWW9_MARPO|nr:hypothetical protein MARPO_YB0040 [Marchantia polymorpha]BBN20453.1 hypothetical protein Mp_Vg00100 [Marchantia polymorpha subsp. ruderalis]|eukprot:PTQ26099.1 hypothetical protein MARPO_YB0040 [Marchantia polymorpha]